MIKVFEISSNHFQISLMQNPIVQYAKETNVLYFCCLHCRWQFEWFGMKNGLGTLGIEELTKGSLTKLMDEKIHFCVFKMYLQSFVV